MIQLPKSLTTEACEDFLEKLDNSDDSELVLPVDTTGAAFGGLAASIQSAITWARRGEARKLLLRNSATINVVDDLVIRPHKFAAAMLAKAIGYENSQDDDLKPSIYAAARDAIESQAKNQYGQWHGRLSWFAFVDHSSKAFDRNFYMDGPNSKPEPRQPAQIQAIIRAMVEKTSAVSGGSKPLDRETQDHIGRMFYELFMNSHEHGTRGSMRSEWLKRGIRIIYAQGINLTEVAVKRIATEQPWLAEYLQAVAVKRSQGEQRRFVEVSIVDSGLGYCDRWRADHSLQPGNKTTPMADDYKIFRNCFEFRMTSSLKEHKGNGLPVVMDRLTKADGFMRIRSGRLALYRNFVSSPYQDNDSCSFCDWITGHNAEQTLSKMPSVSGAAITLLIPLEDKP